MNRKTLLSAFIFLAASAAFATQFEDVTVGTQGKDIRFCGGNITINRTDKGPRDFEVKIQGSNCAYIDWGTNSGVKVAKTRSSSYRSADGTVVDEIRDNGHGQYSWTFQVYLQEDKSKIGVQVRDSYNQSYAGKYDNFYLHTEKLNQGNGY